MASRGLLGNNGGEGVMRLPIGFRFRPTDQELLLHYLKRKALSIPLPAPVILDFDVFLSDPLSLPGDAKEKRRYYFCRGNGLGGKKGVSFTAAGCGFWKANGKMKQIVASTWDGSNVFLGTRKSWAFYHKNDSFGWSRTPWVMHQFLLPSGNQNPDSEEPEWGVCKVIKRRIPKKKPLGNSSRYCNHGGSELPSYIDFKQEENNSSADVGPPEEPSSPSCAGEMIVSDSVSSAEDLAQKE